MWTAADSGELATAMIPAVWTFLGVVVVTLGTIAVQMIKTRSERTAKPVATSTSTDGGNGNGNGTTHLLRIAREVGQLDQRANDNDERDDVQDHELRDQRDVLDEHHDRMTALERYNDRRDPDWRTP